MDLNQGINPAKRNQSGQVKKRINGRLVVVNLYEDPNQDDQDISNAIDSLDQQIIDEHNQSEDYNESDNRTIDIEIAKAVSFYRNHGVLPVNWKHDKDYVTAIAKKVSQKTKFDLNKILQRIR